MPVQRYLILIERDRLAQLNTFLRNYLSTIYAVLNLTFGLLGVYYINSLMAFRRLKEAPSTLDFEKIINVDYSYKSPIPLTARRDPID